MGKVLLVDDERDLVEACTTSLSLAGYEVAGAYDGEEAVGILTKRPFDLVITDLRMPRLDGFALLRWIMSHKSSTKVVVMTAFGTPTVSDTAKRLGALRCLSKPVSKDRLLETVRSILGESGFSATVQNITVADYVQICMYTGKTGFFEVSSGNKKGTIAVVDGTITYVEQGDLKGEEAFFEIISWEGGQINEKKPSGPLPPNVRMGGQSLLLEAFRLKDEAGPARQHMIGLPGKQNSPPPGNGTTITHSSAPSPLQGIDRGADGASHPVSGSPPAAVGTPSDLDGLAEMLNHDGQVAEYGLFSEQDFLQYKRSLTGAILSTAPSLYLKLGDSLKEELLRGALLYVLINTAGGARYMVFDYLNARGVIGLKPGILPEDFWKKLWSRWLSKTQIGIPHAFDLTDVGQ